MKKVLKRVLSISVVFALVVGAFSGCTDKEKNNLSGSKKEISISFWEGSTDKAVERSLTEIGENYKKLHPDVEIKLMSQPSSGYQDWIKARIAADNAPLISMNNAGTIMEQYSNGYLYDFADEFEKENKYADGKKWKDIFIDGKLDTAHDFRTEPCCVVPFGGRGVGIFYNKDIYKKLKLNIPETWNEFMSNCEKIKAKGYNPIAMMAMKPDAVSWLNWYIITGLYANHYLADERINPNKDNFLHTVEYVNAIKKGYIDFTKGFDNEVINKYFDMVEEWGKYSVGASALDEAGAKAQFLSGTAAHIMTGSWDMKTFLENKSVNIGVMDLPAFDDDIKPYVGSNMKFNSVSSLGILKSTKRSDEDYKLAVDFLKFLTSPDQYKIYAEYSMTVPDIKGLDVSKEFKTINQGKAEILNIIRDTPTSPVTSTSALVTAMSGKKYDRNEIIKGIQKAAVAYCDDYINKNKLSEADDYGLANIPMRAPFEPTKSKASK